MKAVELPLPELFGVAATRGMLGAGIALLLVNHLSAQRRHRLGLLLTAVGLASTIPFAHDVLGRIKLK